MEFPRVGQQTYPRPSKAVEWTEITAANGTITLNGGTVTDIAGGIRVTVPGGLLTDEPGLGTYIRWPFRMADGSRPTKADDFILGLRIRELSAPGLSSDTLVRIGLVASGDPMVLASYLFCGGLHYSAATRAEVVQKQSAGALTTTLNGAPTGNARGASLSGLRYARGTGVVGAWLRYWGAEGIAADGSGLSTTDVVAATYAPTNIGPLDVFVAIGRSAATLGAETVDFVAEYLDVGTPR